MEKRYVRIGGMPDGAIGIKIHISNNATRYQGKSNHARAKRCKKMNSLVVLTIREPTPLR